MIRPPISVLVSFLTVVLTVSIAAQDRNKYVTVAIPASGLGSLDTLTSPSFNPEAERLRELVFDSLVTKDEHLDHVGRLASRIEVSGDGKTISFHLRDNVKFHNGKQLRAADAEYTLNEMLRSRGFKSMAFYQRIDGESKPLITGIKTIGERTLVLTISSSDVKELLMSLLASIPIVPAGTVEQIGSSPIGSGAFRFVKVDHVNGIVLLDANSDYWDGSPTIPGVRLKAINDPDLLIESLRNGDVDIVNGLSYWSLSYDSLNKLSAVQTHQFPGTNIRYLVFNTSSKLLKDVRIRKAIAFAIDRRALVDSHLSGRGAVAHSFLPPQSSYYSAGVRYDRDLDKARRLLKEAGYAGEKLTLKVGGYGEESLSLYAAIRQMLAAAGINLEVDIIETSTLYRDLKIGDFELSIGMWIGGNQDPMFLKDAFSTSRIPEHGVSCCNRGRFSDPAVDRTLDEAIATQDPAKKRELFKHAWELISEQVPVLPLHHPSMVIFANKRIGNIAQSPSGDWQFLRNITIETNSK